MLGRVDIQFVQDVEYLAGDRVDLDDLLDLIPEEGDAENVLFS